jgi:hypothetical protein
LAFLDQPRNTWTASSLYPAGGQIPQELTMNQNIISAVFDDRSAAEAAVNELRTAGVETDDLSIIGRDEEQTSVRDGSNEVVDGNATGDAVKGALGGAGIGAFSVLRHWPFREWGPWSQQAQSQAPQFLAPPQSARAPARWPVD